MLFSYFDTQEGTTVVAEALLNTETNKDETTSLFTEEEIAEIKEIALEANEKTQGTSAEEAKFDFALDVEALKASFPIMGKGMLGIFGVTVMIVLVVAIMNKLLSEKK